jgi:hypothetical protein
MLIEARFDIAFECSAQTPMLLQLNLHPSRDAFADAGPCQVDPSRDASLYRSSRQSRYTGRGSRGARRISNRFVIHDSRQPDETPPDVDMTPIADLLNEYSCSYSKAGIATATSSLISSRGISR